MTQVSQRTFGDKQIVCKSLDVTSEMVRVQ